MNIFFPTNQDRVFTVMFLLGIVLGILYDLFKIKRHILRAGKCFLIIDDLLFSVLSIILFLLTVFTVNNGIFRWFELFFCFVGFCVYRATISRLFLKLAFSVSDILTYIFKAAIRIILFPIVFVSDQLKKHFLVPIIIIVSRKNRQRKITSTFYKFI